MPANPFARYLWALLLFIYGAPVMAQDAITYQTPPAAIAALAAEPPTPTVNFDTKGQYMLLLERSSMPGIDELAEPELRIAGMRINPNNFTPSRTGYVTGIKIKDIAGGQEFIISGLPNPLRANNLNWSPAETKFVFTQTNAQTVDLYMVDMKTRAAKKINRTPLNLVMGGSIEWTDETTVYYEGTLKSASAAPTRPLAPKGPVVQQSLGKVAASRTFQDLIKTPHDESLFEFYATSQLIRNTNGTEAKIGAPAIYRSLAFSPDNKYLLVRKIQKPFSYLVPASGFPAAVLVTDLAGRELKTVAKIPSSDATPTGFDNVLNAPRAITWRSDMPATLAWIEPLDSGLIKKNAEFHDALYNLEAPFTGTPVQVCKSKMRMQGTAYTNAGFMMVYEGLAGKQQQKVSRLFFPSMEMKTLFERSTSDAYNNPGTPATIKNKYGRSVINVMNGYVIMRGMGASAKGDFPFISRYNLETNAAEKLWQCADKTYETAGPILDWDAMRFITTKQSQTEAPNYYIRNLKDKSIKAITSFPDPQMELQGVSKQKIQYKRQDGIDLAGNLYLPKGYDAAKDGPLPVIMWAYPREFKNASDAAQIRGSQYTYTRITSGSPVYWVTQGYAVLDNAEMPIVGEGDRQPNDNFIEQLQWSAAAAIDKLAAMGVGDRNRVGVGGHSYGAFMTANLLAHTNLFKAGIARSGAYNRTLTPFGFQNEDRTYWQVPDLYNRMSPFSYADKIKTPLLMIHGEADNNSGTFPLQSERLYNAIKGHGGTVRFVQLPFEAHTYAAKESILHMLWEQHEWLEKYVKNAGGGQKNLAMQAQQPAQIPAAAPVAADKWSTTPNDLEETKITMLATNRTGLPVPLYVVNGKEVKDIEGIDKNLIQSIITVTGEDAKKKYGDKGLNGVVEITLKQ